jgi:nicotinamide-nucleotide amidase
VVRGPGVQAIRQRCEALAAEILGLAVPQAATLAVAESLTAGLVVATLASVPGASQALRGGVIAYATDLKASLLAVDERVLANGGAVQADVALAMAEGAATRLGATHGLATTGVAGPDDQDGQPPGTVFVAVHAPAARRVVGRSGESALTGGRDVVRWAAVELALELLADQLRTSA